MEVLEKRGYYGFVKIDAGGQATVYKTSLGDMSIAIKVVHVENPDSTRLEDDLRRELMIGRNVKHPNLAQVLDLFRSRNKLYIVMPFAENGTIGSLIRNQNNTYICEWNVKAWFCPIVMAVQYLHTNSIAHRDIKLDNVLLDRHFNPLLTDFGFSRFVGRNEQGQIIKTDTFCGTTSYNPPEILGETSYDPFKGDVWCLGVALFIMFNKDYPFDRHQGREKMRKCQLNRDYKYNQMVEEKMSEAAKNMVHIMLEPNPDQRVGINQVCAHIFFPGILRGDDFCNDIQKRFKVLKGQNCAVPASTSNFIDVSQNFATKPAGSPKPAADKKPPAKPVVKTPKK